MTSQNSKEQKSDFSYKETLNLLKTDFSMRANSVSREPEIQNFWANNNIDFELGANNSGKIFTLHEENFRKCISCDPFFKCLDLTPEVLSCF